MIDRPCIFVARRVHAVFAYLTGWTTFLPFARVGVGLTTLGWGCSVVSSYLRGGALIWDLIFSTVVVWSISSMVLKPAYLADKVTELLPAEILSLRFWTRLATLVRLGVWVWAVVTVFALHAPPDPSFEKVPDLIVYGVAFLTPTWLIPAWAVIGGRPPTRTLPGDLRRLKLSLTHTPRPLQVPS